MMDVDGILKRTIAVAVLLFIGVGTWIIGMNLDSDAIALAAGVFLGGMVAFTPAFLFYMAAAQHPQHGRYEQLPPPRVVPPTPPQLPMRDVELIDTRTGRRIVVKMNVLEQRH